MRKLAAVLLVVASGCWSKGADKSAPAPTSTAPDKGGPAGTGSGSDHDAFTVNGPRAAQLPLVEPGDMTAMGNIDKDVVRTVVKQNLAKLQLCYEQTLLANPGIEGKVVVTFTIGIDGTVLDALAAGIHPDVEACVAGKVRSFKFPKPDGGGKVEVSYPFSFRPA